ncbi:MAG TPA: cache domain-containing protein, partial [Allocoleopsis sp.]
MEWQFWRKFQSKLIVLLTFSTITPVLIVGGYNVIISTQSLTNLVTEQMSDQVTNNAEKISIFLAGGQSDILYLSEVPPIQGIVRARDNKGIDKQDNSTTEAWEKRLEIIFNGIMKHSKFYDQLLYIDENGNELVKVIGENGNIKNLPSSQLQNKAQTEYFQKAMKLRSGEVYISPISLYRENNQIQKPYKPIIRYATPIYNSQGKIRGMLVANVLADAFLNTTKEQNSNMRVLIVNEQGYYLQHPEEKKRWGFDLGNNETISKDYSEEIAKKILTESKVFIGTDKENLLSFAQIYPNSKTKENPIFIIYEAPKKIIFSSLNNFTSVAIVITIVSLGLVLIIGIWNIRKMVNSISKLTDTVSGFSVQILSTVAEQERMLNTQSASVQETTVTIDELTASSQQSAQQAESALAGARLALEQVEKGNYAV